MANPIPEDVALEICELIRKQNKEKKISFSKAQCWGCMKVSNKKNDVRYRCYYNSPNLDNRGCQLINKVYDDKYSVN